MSLNDQAEVSPEPGKVRRGWVGLAVVLLVLLVLGVRLLARAAYAADVEKNAEAYGSLVRLMLAAVRPRVQFIAYDDRSPKPEEGSSGVLVADEGGETADGRHRG